MLLRVATPLPWRMFNCYPVFSVAHPSRQAPSNAPACRKRNILLVLPTSLASGALYTSTPTRQKYKKIMHVTQPIQCMKHDDEKSPSAASAGFLSQGAVTHTVDNPTPCFAPSKRQHTHFLGATQCVVVHSVCSSQCRLHSHTTQVAYLHSMFIDCTLITHKIS